MEFLMDYVVMILSALAGGLIYHIFLGGKQAGPFERTLTDNLMMGKRVVVSVDNDCYIFEMKDSRLRITRGTAQFLQEDFDELASTDVSSIDRVQSTDSDETRG
jgi:hypothetical protein